MTRDWRGVASRASLAGLAPLALLAGLALLAAPRAVQAGPPGGGPGGGPMRHGPPPIERVLGDHAEQLGIDDALLEEVQGIAEQARQQEGPLVDALHGEREELRALLDQDAPDEAAVMRQVEAVGAAETELHKHRLHTMLAVRARLTPEQRQGLVKIFEERRAEREERWRQRRDR
jgi:Spy/CpxP family protein refolding chaperone